MEPLRSLKFIGRWMKYINGAEVTQLASMAKLSAGRLPREISDSCIQYWAAWAT